MFFYAFHKILKLVLDLHALIRVVDFSEVNGFYHLSMTYCLHKKSHHRLYMVGLYMVRRCHGGIAHGACHGGIAQN